MSRECQSYNFATLATGRQGSFITRDLEPLKENQPFPGQTTKKWGYRFDFGAFPAKPAK
jgi:hypothetical protein